MMLWSSANDLSFISEGSIVGKLTLRPGVKTIGKINAQFLTQVSKSRTHLMVMKDDA